MYIFVNKWDRKVIRSARQATVSAQYVTKIIEVNATFYDKIDTILAKRMVLLTKLLLKDGKKMLLFVKTTGGWWGKESLT